jgi:hypothetical protein
MSLSLIMTASSSVSERWYFFAEVETAFETVRHWEGVQAGVCQRIFSFTAQMVLVRQSAGAASSLGGSGAADMGAAAWATVWGGTVEALAPEVEIPWKATAEATAPRAAAPQ